MNYWEKRALEREEYWHELTTRELRTLKKYYEAAAVELTKEIAALYALYGKENRLPYSEARRLIKGAEFREWRMSLEEYVKRSMGDEKLLLELNTLAMRSRINRLDALYGKTLMELGDLSERLKEMSDAFFYRAYVEHYYGTLFDIGKEVGLKTPPATLDREKVEKVLATPWHGANYSARIWANRRKLGNAIRETVLRAVHKGESIQQLSRALNKKMDAGYSNAERLVRTEVNHFQNRASADAMIDADFTHYQFVATLDRRTCARCGQHDGEIYPLKEMNQGENAPPLHPRCRCTIIASFGEKTNGTRISEGRKKIPAEVSYKEWRSGIGDTKLENQNAEVPIRVKTKANIIQATFEQAKTLKAAEEFAMKLGVPRVSYEGCAVEAANEWNRALLETFNRFPELKNNFGFVGEAHARNALCEMELTDYFHQILKEKFRQLDERFLRSRAELKASQVILAELKVSRNACAQSFTSNHIVKRRFAGVTMNRDLCGDYRALLEMQKHNEQIKFHPVGCGSVRSILDHEIGHQLDELLGLSNLPEVRALFDSRVVIKNGAADYSRITDELSRYAWDNDNPNRYGEFIAEAWAEYCNNPSPRAIAQKIGEIVKREYAKKFIRGE